MIFALSNLSSVYNVFVLANNQGGSISAATATAGAQNRKMFEKSPNIMKRKDLSQCTCCVVLAHHSQGMCRHSFLRNKNMCFTRALWLCMAVVHYSSAIIVAEGKEQDMRMQTAAPKMGHVKHTGATVHSSSAPWMRIGTNVSSKTKLTLPKRSMQIAGGTAHAQAVCIPVWLFNFTISMPSCIQTPATVCAALPCIVPQELRCGDLQLIQFTCIMDPLTRIKTPCLYLYPSPCSKTESLQHR